MNNICPKCGSNRISRFSSGYPYYIFSQYDWFDEEGTYTCYDCGEQFEVVNKNNELIIT